MKWLTGSMNEIKNSATVTITGGGVLNLNGATQTVSDLTNTSGTFMTGTGSWTGTGASMTWGASSVANTINAGGSVHDIHVKISGGLNTVEAGGALNVDPAGIGLDDFASRLWLRPVVGQEEGR